MQKATITSTSRRPPGRATPSNRDARDFVSVPSTAPAEPHSSGRWNDAACMFSRSRRRLRRGNIRPRVAGARLQFGDFDTDKGRPNMITPKQARACTQHLPGVKHHGSPPHQRPHLPPNRASQASLRLWRRSSGLGTGTCSSRRAHFLHQGPDRPRKPLACARGAHTHMRAANERARPLTARARAPPTAGAASAVHACARARACAPASPPQDK